MIECSRTTGGLVSQISILLLLMILTVLSTYHARRLRNENDPDEFYYSVSIAVIAQILLGLAFVFFVGQFV